VAARAVAVGLRPLLEGGGLLGEAESEYLLGEDFPDFQEGVFDLGEGSTPGGTVRPVELLDQVFGDAFHIGAYFFYLGGAFFGSRHPWLLSKLG
jgi:hypothetical protein